MIGDAGEGGLSISDRLRFPTLGTGKSSSIIETSVWELDAVLDDDELLEIDSLDLWRLARGTSGASPQVPDC